MVKQNSGLNKQFLLLWSGQLLSKTGSGISAYVLGIHILEKTGSTTAFSLMLLSSFLPSVLLNPAGGVIADRVNRRILTAAGDTGAAAGVLIIILFHKIYPDNINLLFAGVSVISVFSALHSPAYKASVTDLLDKEQYSKAGGLIQLAEASRYLLSPAIAGFLLRKISLTAVLGIDCITFIIASASALLIRKTGNKISKKTLLSDKNSFKEDLIYGIRCLSADKSATVLTGLISLITFFTGMLQVLFTPVLVSISDAAAAGRIMSLSASGMLISSIAVSLFNIRNQKRNLKLSLTAAGFFCLMIGISTTAAALSFSAFCFFLTLPVINTSVEVLLRRKIDNTVQARVWSLISFITQTGMILALSVTGILADKVFNPLLSNTSLLSEYLKNYFGPRPDTGSCIMIAAAGLMIICAGAAYNKQGRRNNNISLDTDNFRRAE